MAQLLVSVRSAAEALAALRGGAAVVDVKEPRRGALGRADVATWRAVVAAVAGRVPVSVALGELVDLDRHPGAIPAGALDGIALRKAGPAGLAGRWAGAWDRARRADDAPARWVAVAYLDWEAAGAPEPAAVAAAAVRAADCRGVLFDTWDKAAACPVARIEAQARSIAAIRDSGRLVALAGRLDRESIRRLAPLRPDLFAVRGAACAGGDRDATVAAALVADLVALARTI